MKNARFTWALPTTRQAGGPLDPAAIVGTEIALRVAGVSDWTVIGVAPGTEQEFTQNELDNGGYQARAIVITMGEAGEEVRGAPATISFVVSEDEPVDHSPAAAVQSFAVELS